jgi:transglutaminase-like putative cysteine protease
MHRCMIRAIALLVLLLLAVASLSRQPSITASAAQAQKGSSPTAVPLSWWPPQKRTFNFTYAFTVENPNLGKELRVWFPMPTTDRYQSVSIINVDGDLPLKKTKEKRYGNHMFYAESASADKPQYHFKVLYKITRYERPGLMDAEYGKGPWVAPEELHLFLQPNRLVPVTGALADLASQTTAGKKVELDKARAIYNYVLANMKYDKSGAGWGRGDAEWACASKHGNCTDFHSLFTSMTRSQGIPTRFEIGFPLPTDKHAAEIPGYHCWADFYLNASSRHGWIPVDISEAWQHPGKTDYFFGTLDANRVQFSIGRDLTLAPRQDGPPVNYFVYAYVESDGREFPNVKNSFWFTDVGGREEQARNGAASTSPAPNHDRFGS